MYFDLGDEVGGEGSMVLTGTGAAPPIPPDSRFRTLGSKHATHCRFHLSPDQCCRSEGEQKRCHQSSPACLPMPFTSQQALSPVSPRWPPTCCQSTSQKLGSATPLAWALPVMLADNQVQAFSIASPTAMFSALLRTCDKKDCRVGLAEGWG